MIDLFKKAIVNLPIRLKENFYIAWISSNYFESLLLVSNGVQNKDIGTASQALQTVTQASWIGCERALPAWLGSHWKGVFRCANFFLSLPHLTLGRIRKFIPLHVVQGGRMEGPTLEFLICCNISFYLQWKAFLSRCDIFFWWCCCWRPVMSSAMVTIFAAILDFTKT